VIDNQKRRAKGRPRHMMISEANMIASDRSNNSISRFLRGSATRCLLVAVPLAIAPAAHAGYAVTDITDPTGNNFINVLGINSSLTIAGFDNNNPAQSFTAVPPYLPGNFTSVVPSFPGETVTSSMATGINAAGDLSGIYMDSAGNTHGYTDIGGVFKTVDNPLSTVFNQALGINNSDETVGYYAPTQAGMTNQIAYSQQGGVFTDINHLLPSNVNSQAVGINSVSTPWIVGFYQPTSTTSLGFLDVGGTITTLDPFGSTFTQALGVNDLGEIVGFYVDGSNVQHGYIDNSGVFTSFDPSGSVNTTINGLNDKGDIAGFFTDNNDDVVGFVGTPVPEPATWAMMLLGFAGFGFLGYRKVRRGTAAA
jgi:PEP-CTERM motif